VNLLIVDDIATNRKLLRVTLEAEGHTVLEAADGVEALQILGREKVDAVISDILMPNMDGFRLCHEIRKTESLRALPFIIYSSTYNSPDDMKLALAIGADKYLTKPAPTSAMVEALREVTARRTSTPAAPTHAVEEAYVLKQYSQALVHKLEEKNAELKQSMEASQRAHDRIIELNEGLEKRVTERTTESASATAKLQAVLDSATQVSIIATDLDGLVTVFNSGSEQMFGYTAAEVVGKQTPAILLLESELRARSAELSAQFGKPFAGLEVMFEIARLETFEEREWTCVRKDGSQILVSLVITVLRTAGQVTGYLGVTTDITERREMEKRLRLQSAALESAANGVVITSVTGAIQWVNPAFTRLTGYEAGEVIGQNPHILKSGQHSPEFYRELWSVITAGKSWHGEIINRRKDGSLYAEEMTIAPVSDRNGRINHFVAIKQDITGRRQAQADLLQTKEATEAANRLLSQRNEEIQNFYHTLSHELKTPMTSAREFISLVMDGLAGPVNEKQLEYLGYARESCDQLTVCVNDLMDTTRLETGKLAVYLLKGSLEAVAHRVVEGFRSVAHAKKLNLQLEVQPGLPDITFDDARISQVLGNLLNNAAKFTPEGGAIRVAVTVAPGHPEFLQVAVSDTGRGISQAAQARIFDRLYQVKAGDATTEKGIGLGLYICRELMLLQGGEISVESEPGQGSTFKFTLPLKPLAKRNTILVVDDDASLRDITRKVLEQAGYIVSTANDGREGLELMERELPSLLILDLEMPVLDGAATLKQIRETWGSVPVIVHTGQATSGLMDRALESSPFTVLAKPCGAAQLLETVQQVRNQFDTKFWRRSQLQPPVRETSETETNS